MHGITSSKWLETMELCGGGVGSRNEFRFYPPKRGLRSEHDPPLSDTHHMSFVASLPTTPRCPSLMMSLRYLLLLQQSHRPIGYWGACLAFQEVKVSFRK